MDWTQVLSVFTVIVANLGTIITIYIQMDKKMDENRVSMDKKMDENRVLMDKKMDENRRETNEILRAIQIEMKDFHGRLCAIEERNKGK